MLQYYLSPQYHATETDDFLFTHAADSSVTLPVRRKVMALSLSVPCVLLGATPSAPASVNWKWEGEILYRPLRVSCNCVPMYSRPRFVDSLLMSCSPISLSHKQTNGSLHCLLTPLFMQCIIDLGDTFLTPGTVVPLVVPSPQAASVSPQGLAFSFWQTTRWFSNAIL